MTKIARMMTKCGSDTEAEEELQGEPTSAEGRLLKELADRNDQWHVQKALDALHGVGRSVMTMHEHSDNLFTTNTEEGTKAKFSDWHMFLKVVYRGISGQSSQVAFTSALLPTVSGVSPLWLVLAVQSMLPLMLLGARVSENLQHGRITLRVTVTFFWSCLQRLQARTDRSFESSG